MASSTPTRKPANGDRERMDGTTHNRRWRTAPPWTTQRAPTAARTARWIVAGSPDDYQAHTLHVEPDSAFSIVGLVWRPGRGTRIHDHITWCVFGVIGIEHEELFDAELNLIGRSDNHVGDVKGFAPPGEIHRVHNTAEETAISIHVHGTDVTRTGSSARRYYD
jgi:predicted metal-dependent enzyme (double-stranded beta helix superfamily)